MDHKTLDGIPVTSEAGIDVDAVISSAQFKDWLASMDRSRFTIKSVHIQSVDKFGPKIGFIKFKADLADSRGKFLPGIIFMRGNSVGILPVFTCKGRSYAVLTVQPRAATGRFDFVEIPAGMLDGSGNFGGTAAKELDEELGLKITEAELTDLSGLAGLNTGFYPSPGGCDEAIRLFTFTREVSEDEMAAMNGKCTGLLSEGEQITLKIVPIDELWSIPDGKTIAAIALYQRFVASN
jgi:ADP-sugar diphosphatase